MSHQPEIDLEFLTAEWHLGLITPYDLKQIADRLLAAGFVSDSLVELFAQTWHASPWVGPELFEKALVELGQPRLNPHSAAGVAARSIARRVLDGSLAPAEACKLAAQINWRTGYQHDVFLDLAVLDHEYVDGHLVTADDVRRAALRILAMEEDSQ